MAALCSACLLAGCTPPEERRDSVALKVPPGYMPVLEIERGAGLYKFGPFVGYYFRPEKAGSFEVLRFVCFNENDFYTLDKPANALLFEGEAVLTELPESEKARPSGEARIQPVFTDDLPEKWLASRPEPQDEFRHFHSCYNDKGAVRLGYWLRHRAKGRFLYDMGGRVGPESPLYHRVEEGIDRDFALIVEFDEGPAGR